MKSDSVTVQMKVPSSLLSALDVSQPELEKHLQQILVLGLIREQRISVGKGAEILGVSKLDMIQILAQQGVNYFDQTPENLEAEVAAVEDILDGVSL